ncbi:MAG TPA: hypothetical protein VMQ51_14030 [Candidatus Binatia bacterium]|nr:hypothetical protein [Candidatus Binatia bacterium]
MAAYGVARSTQDLDVLTLDPVCLAPVTWRALTAAGVTVDIRHGDEADPLRGAVHMATATALVDVIVGRAAWQAGVLQRAVPRSIDGSVVPVASSGDLLVLKLYAGGPQDAWDIEQLLAAGDRPSLMRHVETVLPELPEHAQPLWARIVRPG